MSKIPNKLPSKSDTSVVSTGQERKWVEGFCPCNCHCGLTDCFVKHQKVCEHCTQQKDAGWEKEFERKFVCTTTPHMPCEHVFPEGDSYGVKAFISKVATQARQQAFQESLEAVGENDKLLGSEPLGNITEVVNITKELIRANIEKRRKNE